MIKDKIIQARLLQFLLQKGIRFVTFLNDDTTVKDISV